MTTFASETAPAGASLTDLAATVRGQVFAPGEDGYAALATPWNVAKASAPVAVVAVLDAADVAATIRFAGEHDLDVAVQCTGHGATAYSRPTLLVHTGRLDTVDIDPVGASAHVGSGVRWQQVLDAAAPYGMAALAGSAPDVGVVGYLTGGGLSPVGRSYGFGADHVTSFEVVTGDGVVRTASAEENPGLFWGLRGGKGALGIVTSVSFDLLRLSEIYAGCLYYDGADAAKVLHAWRNWTETLPEEASTSIAVLRLPAVPSVPLRLAGSTTVAVRFGWTGDHAEGERVLTPMREVAEVIFGGVGPMPFTALEGIHSDPTDPMPVHEEAQLLRELPADAVDTLIGLVGPEADCPQIIVELRLLGGAVARPPRFPSAVSHRDAAFTLMAIGLGVPPVVEAATAHGLALVEAMRPWSDGHRQANFGSSSDAARVARNYDAPTLARLATMAATYDPKGLLTAARPVLEACVLRTH